MFYVVTPRPICFQRKITRKYVSSEKGKNAIFVKFTTTLIISCWFVQYILVRHTWFIGYSQFSASSCRVLSKFKVGNKQNTDVIIKNYTYIHLYLWFLPCTCVYLWNLFYVEPSLIWFNQNAGATTPCLVRAIWGLFFITIINQGLDYHR